MTNENKQLVQTELSEVVLADEGNISEVQLLRTGKFDYHGAPLNITKDILLSLKENFDNNTLKTDLAIDYFHKSSAEAAGWIKDVILKDDNSALWINVEWTDKAKEKLLSKEIRYLSADFDFNYTDNETKKKHGATLRGGGLTNRPFVKGMKAILSEDEGEFDKNSVSVENGTEETVKTNLNNDVQLKEEKENKKMNLSDIKKEAVTLSENEKKDLASSLGVQLDSEIKLSEKVEALEAENVKLSEKVKLAEKTTKFEALLSEGKVVESQREAYLSDDMEAFVKNSVAVNLENKGTGAPQLSENGEEMSASDANVKFSEMVEAKAKKDNISFDEAEEIVSQENPKLAEKAFSL